MYMEQPQIALFKQRFERKNTVREILRGNFITRRDVSFSYKSLTKYI